MGCKSQLEMESPGRQKATSLFYAADFPQRLS